MNILGTPKIIISPPPRTVDPAVFGSELALRTEWLPLKPQIGSNFCTHRLRREFRDGSLRFAGTGQSQLFGLACLGSGLVVFSIGVFGVIQWSDKLFVSLSGLFIMAVGSLVWRQSRTAIVFSQIHDAFYRSRKNPDRVDANTLDNYTLFKEIAALQLLEKFIRGNSPKSISYFCYELNLICRDGRRVEVVCHGSYPKLREDAMELAEMLQVPLWDVVAAAEAEKAASIGKSL